MYVNVIVALVSNFTVWLLLYGKIIDFCILTLSPATILSLLSNCRNFFFQFILVFYTWDYAICEQILFYLFLPNLYAFYSFFVLLIKLSRMWKTVVRGGTFAFFLICVQTLCGALGYTEILTGNGSPLEYSCLENPMDQGALWATVHGVSKSWTWLSYWAH